MSQPQHFPRTDELRLALVLNGGVSLAVWMGGVAFELNRLVRETHPVYRGLLELTATAARIDVISGTSAGGINGAALALAQIHDRSLYGLRDVWLRVGGLDTLLHDPDGDDVTSLLRGDEFLAQIRAAFAELEGDSPAPPRLVPLSLSLTSTLLDGVDHRSVDDFGAQIEDTVHRALWQFPHLPDDDAFADARIVDQLAFAARSTASFPVAFAPAAFSAKGDPFENAARLKVRTERPRALSDDAFLLDGGILDNKPFDAALEAISRLPAEGNTRRVLAYVVPDPAAAAERRALGPDGKLEPPTLAQAAWRSLVSIPASQSIGSHMAELREHNDTASARWRRIVGAVGRLQGPVLLAWGRDALETYRARRVDGMIEYFLGEIERHIAPDDGAASGASPAGPNGAHGPARNAVPVKGMRRATRQWLASYWRRTAQAAIEERSGHGYWGFVARDAVEGPPRSLQEELTRHWAWRLPETFDPRRPVLEGRWSWGLYALEFVSEFTTEVLRRTQRLYVLVPRWKQRSQQTIKNAPPLPAADKARDAQDARDARDAREAIGDDLVTDLRPSIARETLVHEGTRIAEPDLAPQWRAAYRMAARVRKRRRDADRDVGQLGVEGFLEFVRSWAARGGEQPPEDDARKMLAVLLRLGEERGTDNRRIARVLCCVLLQLRERIDAILAVHEAGTGRMDVDEAVADLKALRDYLYEPVEGEPAAPTRDQLLDRIAWRVLALEVFEVTACSRRRAPSAQGEVIQISARLSSAFGGSADPAHKLAGMQLAHFGAFYKRSWRANDWTFGCLDGIDRAVRIALNPDALQRRYGDRRIPVHGEPQPLKAAEYVERYLYALAVSGADHEIAGYLGKLWNAELPRIRAELAWLDKEATVPPPVLENCAQALTRRLQLETLRRELPEIAKSLMEEWHGGAPPSAHAGAALLARVAPGGQARVPSPEDAAHLVQRDLLGRETLRDQVGTDQLTRTVSQALATAHTALSSKHGGLGALNVVMKVLEWPLRVFYWLGNRLVAGTKTSAAVDAAAWGVGAALVIAGGLDGHTSGALLAFGWAVLAGATAMTFVRSPRWGSALVIVAATALVFFHRKPDLWLVLAPVLVVFLMLLTRIGALVAMLIVIGAAAWWSAGASPDAPAVVFQKYRALPGGAAASAPSASAAAAAERLEATLWPALVVGILLVTAAAFRAIAGPTAVPEGHVSMKRWQQLSRLARWRTRQRQRVEHWFRKLRT